MMPVGQILSDNVRLLRAKATRPAVYGVLIATLAVIIGTVLAAFVSYGSISAENIIKAQSSNVALWVLDLTPFAFALWGQYVSTLMAYEAGSMVMDQTQALRTRTTALEYQAMHDATHDHLTDLPNRILLLDRLEQALHSAQREKRKLAVLLLDLDRFKEINDTLGHYQGDRLLKHVSSRLKHVVREADTLARLGGDEFAVVLHHLATLDDIHTVVTKIRKALAPSYMLDGLNLDVQASIGGALFPDHGTDPDTLLQRADIAMYTAKQEKSGFVLYTPQLDHNSPRRLTLMSELRDAIKNGELSLRFQPMVDSRSNEVPELEVLVRWEHKQHGVMTPDEFIPMAERTGLIYPLTLWVLKHALEQQMEWRKIGLDMGVAVNISAQTLLDPEFPDQVTGLLAAYDVPTERLILEITESSIMFDQELALHILSRFAEMGVRIAIDDFGTGYSSLSYLKKLPVCQLKIDKSFVLDMLSNENDAVIVNATIDLAHNLGLRVVAEGVENAETFERLKSRGCDALQGYYINYPVKGENFPAWYYSAARSGGGANNLASTT